MKVARKHQQMYFTCRHFTLAHAVTNFGINSLSLKANECVLMQSKFNTVKLLSCFKPLTVSHDFNFFPPSELIERFGYLAVNFEKFKDAI